MAYINVFLNKYININFILEQKIYVNFDVLNTWL